MNTLISYVLSAMLAWCPTSSATRASSYEAEARRIARATSDPIDAIHLAAIGADESGYVTDAVNPKSGAFGVYQLLPLFPCTRWDLDCQTREALRRLHTQGMAGYTGEANASSYPLAIARWARAVAWLDRHPFAP